MFWRIVQACHSMCVCCVCMFSAKVRVFTEGRESIFFFCVTGNAIDVHCPADKRIDRERIRSRKSLVTVPFRIRRVASSESG